MKVNKVSDVSGSLIWKEQMVSVDLLKPYEKNPRKINDADFERLMTSLRKFGQFAPLIVTQDMKLASGHQRLKAFKKLGWKEIRVSVPDRSLTHDEFREILYRANINNGQYDIDLLAEEFKVFELEEWGADGATLRKLSQSEVPDNADDVPEISEIIITKPSDVWILDDHRLMCGDSTNKDDVATLLAGAVPHLMVTDPPYGVEYDANWRNEAMPTKNDPARRRDGQGRAIGAVMNDSRANWREAWALFPGDVAYVWHAGLHSHVVAESLIATGFDLRAQIIWAKPSIVLSRGHYHWKHEPCWYAVRPTGTGHWQGDRKQSTLWEIAGMIPIGRGTVESQDDKSTHSTQKPVECMKRPIENNSKVGESVYEPFSGSGTTIIAAEIAKRKCYAMELSPQYCDMAINRWVKFTGKIARRESDGMIVGITTIS